MSRQYLVFKPVCAKCGSNLNLSYEVPRAAGQHAEGEPTGASMVEQLVAIEPCERCMEPLHRARKAMAALMELKA